MVQNMYSTMSGSGVPSRVLVVYSLKAPFSTVFTMAVIFAALISVPNAKCYAFFVTSTEFEYTLSVQDVSSVK
jgi:hypothetical protein